MVTSHANRAGWIIVLLLLIAGGSGRLLPAVARLATLRESAEAIAMAMEVPLKEVQRLLKLAEVDTATGDQAGALPAASA